MTDTLLTALALIPALVIAIVFHEVAHGWTALALGDPTAKERKRLTLNPIRHVDPIGTLVVPGALALSGLPVFGWAKPVPVTQQRLRNPRYGMMAVAAAGPATNLVLAAVAAVLLGLFGPEGARLALSGSGMPVIAGSDGAISMAGTFAFVLILINVFLALFNLLPVPPFDGSHIVEGLLPPRAARAYERLRPFGLPLLFLLLLVIPWLFPGMGIVERVVLPPVIWVQDQYLALAALVAGA
jgi:Zn-dependent protease